MTLKEQIVELLLDHPGLSDREITNRIAGKTALQQPVNAACKDLERRGQIMRRKREDGRIGNYLSDVIPPIQDPSPIGSPSDEPDQTEDGIKRALESWLKAQGWTLKIAWASTHGVDIEATKGGEPRWLIEVKGCGSRPQMRANYFQAILGQIMQRMSDPTAKYSIALPDLSDFRGLWKRLPDAAKTQTGVSALFVRADGAVTELRAIPSLDEIAGLADAARRHLLGLLDWVDGKPPLEMEKGQQRISRLLAERKIPRHTANCMRLVLGFRNAVVYVPSEPTFLEFAAWQAARDAILGWAKKKGWSG